MGNVCIGAAMALTDATTGGTWGSSNTAIGSISGSGTVTGIAAGTTIISYTVSRLMWHHYYYNPSYRKLQSCYYYWYYYQCKLLRVEYRKHQYYYYRRHPRIYLFMEPWQRYLFYALRSYIWKLLSNSYCMRMGVLRGLRQP